MIRFIMFVFLVFILTAATQLETQVTVFLIGDSTMSEKEESAYPETGWGMPFKMFFDSTVSVENHAKNGRSTKTFLSENRWETVYGKLRKGDYVFIQFGHNDEVKEKVERYTTPEEYKNNLRHFIAETKKKNAIPVLLTPVSRRKFLEGKAIPTHALYSDLVREVAAETRVAFIDLDVKSQALYQKLGEEGSKLLFLHLEPGEHPNYPEGKNDNTHFNELGARKIAQLVLAGMADIDLELTRHISRGKSK
jgi:lysophospholipase L1-like esterase